MADDIVSLSGDGLKFGRSPVNGELLIGNGSGFNLSTLTGGSNVTISNSSGGITISSSNSGGTLTAVTGTAPITSTGGSTPDIGLTTPLVAQYGGTGLATITSDSLMVGNGTGTVGLIAPGTSGNLLTSNGTTWASAAPPAVSWTLIKKTTDQSITSSTTFVDDTELQFAASAGVTYTIYGVYFSTVSGGGSQYAINGPAASRIRLLVNFNGSTLASTAYNSASGANSATGSFAFSPSFVAMITTTAAGTIAMRIAQNRSSANATVFEKGSWLQYAAV